MEIPASRFTLKYWICIERARYPKYIIYIYMSTWSTDIYICIYTYMNYDVIPISFSGPSHCLPISLSWPKKDYLYLSTMHAVTCLSSLHQNVKNHSSWIISTNPSSKWKSTKLYSPKGAWVLHPPPNVHLTSAIVDVKIEKLEPPRVVVRPAQWEWHDVWYKTELYNQVRSKWGKSLHHCTCTQTHK